MKWCNRDEEKANSVSQQQLAFHNPRACSIWWQMWSFLISRCYICLLRKCQMQMEKERRGREHEKVWHEPLGWGKSPIRLHQILDLASEYALSLHLSTKCIFFHRQPFKVSNYYDNLLWQYFFGKQLASILLIFHYSRCCAVFIFERCEMDFFPLCVVFHHRAG